MRQGLPKLSKATPRHIVVGFAPRARPFLTEVMRGVARFADGHPHWRLTLLDLLDFDLADRLPWDELDSPPDGAITGVTAESRARVAAWPCPKVLVTPEGLAEGTTWVGPDYRTVGAMAAAYFLERGYRTLALFNHGDTQRQDACLIRESFERHLVERGLSASVFTRGPRTAARGVWRYHDQREDLADFLEALPAPVGLLCIDDRHAWRAAEACRVRGIDVPQRVAILGVGNDPFICDCARPTVSSIALDHQEIGYLAAAALERELSGQRAPRRTMIAPIEIVARQSTGHVAVSDPDVLAAMRHIGEHLEEHLTVEGISEAVLISPRTLLRKFTAALGRAPGQEVRRQRVEAATRLIRTTRKPFTLIALETGLGPHSALCRTIKAVTGLTPAQLRRHHQGT